MTQRVLLVVCLFLATSLAAARGKEFSLQLDPKQWEDIGNPAHFDDDLIVMRSGEKVWGKLQDIPVLHYSFGEVGFRIGEVAGISFAEGDKIQVVTRNGQNFVGTMPSQPLSFDVRHVTEKKRPHQGFPFGIFEEVSYVSKKIPPQAVNFILLKQRGRNYKLVNQRFHSVILSNGDRFPVIMGTDRIRLTDGWKDFSLNPQDIVDVQFQGGLQGYTKGEGLDQELRFSFVKDKFLPARLAKDGQRLKIPWSQISRIKGDMGEFILTTPYLFSQASPGGMVYIPPGRFVMGADEPIVQMVKSARTIASRAALGGVTIHQKEAIARGLVPTKEDPSYVVEMPGFYIDKHEVTNSQYQQFVRATGRHHPRHWPKGEIPRGLENHPVVNVTFADAQAYARWVGKRLPTEVEWERAAKGGMGARYPYGKQFAHGLDNVSGKDTKPVATYASAVARFGAEPKSTADQVFDMTGNVAEWTLSPYHPLPVPQEKKLYRFEKMRHAASSAVKVVRGGSYTHSQHTATTHHRTAMHESDFNSRTGFRCVSDKPPEQR